MCFEYTIKTGLQLRSQNLKSRYWLSSEINDYKCEECGVSFKSQLELQEHNNQEHIGTA